MGVMLWRLYTFGSIVHMHVLEQHIIDVFLSRQHLFQYATHQATFSVLQPVMGNNGVTSNGVTNSVTFFNNR